MSQKFHLDYTKSPPRSILHSVPPFQNQAIQKSRNATSKFAILFTFILLMVSPHLAFSNGVVTSALIASTIFDSSTLCFFNNAIVLLIVDSHLSIISTILLADTPRFSSTNNFILSFILSLIAITGSPDTFIPSLPIFSIDSLRAWRRRFAVYQ